MASWTKGNMLKSWRGYDKDWKALEIDTIRTEKIRRLKDLDAFGYQAAKGLKKVLKMILRFNG